MTSPSLSLNEVEQPDEPVADESDELLEQSPTSGNDNLNILYFALPALILCTFVRSFDDSFVINNYARRIGNEVGQFQNARWLILGYLVTESSLFPLYGHAAQVYGQRAAMLFAATALSVAMLFCALSYKLWQLALSRVVIGIGDAGIELLVVTIIKDLVQLHQLPLWTSATTISGTVGFMLGGPIGAALMDRIGFRSTFAIELCGMIITVLVLFYTLRLPVPSSMKGNDVPSRIEWASSLALVACVAAPILAINLGGEMLAWTHPAVIALLCSTPIWIATLLYTERRVAITPILPGRFLSNNSVVIALACILPMKFGCDQLRFSFGTYLEARSFRTGSGFGDWALTCFYMGRPLGYFVSGLLVARHRRFKPFLQITIAIDLVIYAAFALGLIHPERPTYAPLIFLTGATEGLAEAFWLVALLALVDTRDQSLLYAFFMLATAVAGDAGIAISLATESSLFRSKLMSHLAGYENADEIIRESLKNLTYIRQLPSEIQDSILKALASSVETAFGISCIVLLISLIASVFMKDTMGARRTAVG